MIERLLQVLAVQREVESDTALTPLEMSMQ